MKRVNTRGIKQANKHVMMAALCYNLKKLLKFEKASPKIDFQTIEIQLVKALKTTLFLLFGFTTPYKFSEQQLVVKII